MRCSGSASATQRSAPARPRGVARSTTHSPLPGRRDTRVRPYGHSRKGALMAGTAGVQAHVGFDGAFGEPVKDCPSRMSGHRLLRVDLHGEWRILVVTNMADDETGAPALSYDPAAAERVRQLLSSRNDVVEKKMVGGLSFLVNGNMCCGITGMALMVRVGAESREQALREPHVRPMLFAGRPLSGF